MTRQFPHAFTTLPPTDMEKVRGFTSPTMSGLLSDNAPLSDQLRTASQQLRGMLDGGELDALASDTRVAFVALAIFLHGAAARTSITTEERL